MHSNELVGTWSLVSFVAVGPNGEEAHPWGKNPIGQLIYTESGHMSGVLSRAGRSKFASPDPRAGTTEEIKQAFEGMEAYAGTYEVNSAEGVVTHHPAVCRLPNWEGRDQKRHFVLRGEELSLSTAPVLAHGAEWTLNLIWRRMA